MRIWMLLSTTALLAACASSANVPDAPSLNGRRYANLKKMAAKDLSCDQKLLAHSYEGENMHRMSGCNTDGLYELRCVMGSCVWIPDVRQRAAFDLSCERSRIRVTNLGRDSKGVAGCGRKATYMMNPMSGDWILNSDVEQLPEPAPGPKKDTVIDT